MNTAAVKALEKQGVLLGTIAKNGYTSLIPSGGALFRLHEASRDLKYTGKNAERYREESLNPPDPHWYGATGKEFTNQGKGDVDTQLFLEARASLNSRLKNLAHNSLFTAPKRIREFSEYDGELDYDRRFERQPFSSTRRTKTGLMRHVEVIVNMGFNCGIEASVINRYGALAWAIVDLIGKAGVQVTLKLAYKGHSLNDYDEKPHCDIVLVKNASDYSDPLGFARCFTAAFFRMGIFNFWSMQAEALGLGVTSGLGSSANGVISARPGYLELALTDVTRNPKPDELLKLLTKTLKNGDK